MFTPNEPQFAQSGISGPFPAHWFGVNAINGTAGHWARAPKGSTYTRLDLTNNIKLGTFTKMKEDSRTDDWCEIIGLITETVGIADFTDGGSTTGTYTLKRQIPDGAYYIRTTALNITGFTGDTTAVAQVGDGSDVDRFNTSTFNVFADASSVSTGAASGATLISAATSIVITITSATDFTLVTAGQLTIRCYIYN